MKSTLFAAASIVLAAGPALASEPPVPESSGLGVVAVAFGVLLVAKLARRK